MTERRLPYYPKLPYPMFKHNVDVIVSVQDGKPRKIEDPLANHSAFLELPLARILLKKMDITNGNITTLLSTGHFSAFAFTPKEWLEFSLFPEDINSAYDATIEHLIKQSPMSVYVPLEELFYTATSEYERAFMRATIVADVFVDEMDRKKRLIFQQKSHEKEKMTMKNRLITYMMYNQIQQTTPKGKIDFAQEMEKYLSTIVK